MKFNNKIIIDLDGTLTKNDIDVSYELQKADEDVIRKLQFYSQQGLGIVIHTARNMRKFNGNIGEINVHTLPLIIAWLQEHNVPFDEIVVGKPWCGEDGFYVDDRAIRPDEFKRLDFNNIKKIIGR